MRSEHYGSCQRQQNLRLSGPILLVPNYEIFFLPFISPLLMTRDAGRGAGKKYLNHANSMKYTSRWRFSLPVEPYCLGSSIHSLSIVLAPSVQCV